MNLKTAKNGRIDRLHVDAERSVNKFRGGKPTVTEWLTKKKPVRQTAS